MFVTGTTGGACGEKSVMWRNSLDDRLSCGENLHMADCHVEKYLHIVNVEKICPMGKVQTTFNMDSSQ